jgi:hypothetical protein
MPKQNANWGKRLLVTGLVLAIIAAGIYWYVATEKFSDTKGEKADFTVNALDFIREFRKNDSAANKKYREMIVEVRGKISELEAPDSSTLNVKMIDSSTGDYVIFEFQDVHAKEAKALTVGDSILIKGSCSGGHFSDILEKYSINFKRSALSK